MEKKKIIIISIIAFLGILLIGGVTYSWFNYTGVSNVSNTIIAGDIRMNVTEGSDTLTLPNVFPETKEEAREREDNTLTFTVSGTNETGKAILYNILLSEGTTKSGKTRFRDNEIMFDLVEIINNNEVYLVEAVSYETLNNTNIYDNIIPASTTNVSHTYKLRAWINENVIISETEEGDHVYHPSDYKDLYATIKIGVRGNTVSGESYTVTFDADGGVVPISTKNVIVGQNYGYLPTPTKEGYTFLGWNGKNLLDLRNLRTYSNVTISDGVVIQNIADSKTSLQWKIQRFLNGTYVNTPYSYVMNNIGIVILPFKKDSSFNAIRFGLNGTERDTTPMYYLNDDILDNVDYVLSFNVTNTTQGSISWNNMQIEEGTTATEYEPYYVTSNVKVTQEKNHTLKAIWQANS